MMELRKKLNLWMEKEAHQNRKEASKEDYVFSVFLLKDDCVFSVFLLKVIFFLNLQEKVPLPI
jgi:heme/copper-type cytochrome/quinol oxidase subunit 3